MTVLVMGGTGNVGAAVVRGLRGRGHAGASRPLSGPEALTPPEQVRPLGEALGRYLVHEVQPDEEAGDAGVDIFRNHPELESEVQDTVPELLGRPPGSLRDWLLGNRTAFG
jgi:uncharacterized protein YbjT (DUF2867 family)